MKTIIVLAVSLTVLLLLITSCATTTTTHRERWYNEEVERLNIVKHAEELIGIRDLKKIDSVYRNDCSGFVIGLYRILGYKIKLDYPVASRRFTLSQLLFVNLRKYGYLYTTGVPKKADVVFFKGTVPSMPNRVSHVGIVDDVLSDRTIIIIHYGSRGIAEIKMNLLHPHIHKTKSGRVLNDFILKKGAGRYLLAAEHFAGFGDLYRFSTERNRY